MAQLWHNYLYTPLLNFLMFLYNGPAFGSLGVAVIELTVLLRVILLPFSILDEGNRRRFEMLSRRLESIDRDFKGDPVLKKEKIRELLRRQKVNYWSKVLVLGAQLVVLILIYQVFIGGIRFTSSEALFSWVSAPSAVNTRFLGFDLGARSLFWPALVAVVLFAEIYARQKRREHLVTKSDVAYLIFFPLFSFFALLLLPMVKSLFIFTSMMFSVLLLAFRAAVFPVRKTEIDQG